MREPPQRNSRPFQRRSQAKGWLFGLLAALATFPGCGGGGASSGSPPPPSPATIVVTPATGNVLLGESLQFGATTNGTAINSVTWSVNGITGGTAASGTISSAGMYTAPADLPVVANVRIAAASTADSTNRGSAQLTLTSDITIG